MGVNPDIKNGSCSFAEINLDLFNAYMKAKSIKTHDSIQLKYIQIIGDYSNTDTILRITTYDQMRWFLRGTSLIMPAGNDTINLADMKLDFNNGSIYWIPSSGFFRFKFYFEEPDILCVFKTIFTKSV